MKKFKFAVAAGLATTMLAGSTLGVSAAGLRDVFSAKYYADMYPDLKEAYGYDEELLYRHFLAYGLEEGRNMSPVLDVRKYREMYADLEEVLGDNWDLYVQHFLEYGIQENRTTGTNFDVRTYLTAYDDLEEAFGDDFVAAINHYLNVGFEENRTYGDPVAYQESLRPAPAPSTGGNSSSGGSNTGSGNNPGGDDSQVEAGRITILYPGEPTARFSEFLENEFADKAMEDIGLEIEMIYLPWDQYWTQKDIMLSAGEEIDLYWDGIADLKTIVNRGQAQPLDELLDTYGQNVKEVIGEDRLGFGKVNGEIYGIPSAVGPSSALYQQVCVRQDLLDAVGMDTIATAEDLYDYAVAVKTQFPAMKGPADIIYKPLTRAFQTEQLTWVSGNEIAVYGEESNRVYSYFETETFKKVAQFNEKMYNEGLYGDELTTNYGERDSRMMSGDYIWMEASFGKHMEIKYTTQQNAPEAELNTYLLQPEADKYITTAGGEGLYIPRSAVNPEGAMMFLNWLYGSAENHQFAIYGVEGIDYVMDDGRIERLTTEDFFYEWMFRVADYTLFPVGVDQEYIDAYKTWDDNAKCSDTAGFVFDNSNVLEIETAIREVINNDLGVIRNGFVNFDENYPAAIEKLKEAGIDEYIAEVSAQFAEHMANR